ncbi:MAG: D-alanine--D-alanine ligase [Treponema sp.]|jgi:D-alanine-D-alanine ligase|nr:D-alanine--D-alanine ligase [Treponema sp.]
MRKLTVGILFGGKSAEHEVSLQSAQNVFDAMDRNKYNPILIGIDKTGAWHSPKDSAHAGGGCRNFILNTDNPKRIALNTDSAGVTLIPESRGELVYADTLTRAQDASPALIIDVMFPILHGPFGEDGTIQGFLKLAGVPFVGAGVLGSAVGMDKDVMKRLLRDAGLPICAFMSLRSHDPLPDYQSVVDRLGEPVFVKPANMGSSIGIRKAHNEDEYKRALREAFEYDTKIIIEEFVKGREIECSVLGNETVIASVAGEVISQREFYSYNAKYLDENGARLEIPADLPPETAALVQDLAIKTFKTLSCEGLSRIDFFLRPDNTLLINEINTMPGFTKISMYPKLWEASGVSYSELIDRLIELAIRRFEKEKRLKTSYIDA